MRRSALSAGRYRKSEVPGVKARRGGKERVEGSSGDKILPSPDRARATPPLEKKKKNPKPPK